MISKEQAAEKAIAEFITGINELPEWVKLYKINHHSPSQANTSDDMWGYKYLYLSQEERRDLPINSKMFSGVCIGDMGQLEFGNFIWEYEKGKGLTKKPIPPTRKVFEKIIEKFNQYGPANEDDKIQHDVNRKGLALLFDQFKKGFREVGLKGEIECERSVEMMLPDCVLPMIGRVDFEDADQFIELKTKWRKKNRPRKDGTSSYSLPKIDEGYLGWNEHLLQVAFYFLATGKKPNLLVVHEEGYNLFNEDNCDDLKPENLKLLLNKMKIVCSNREKIMEKHAGKNTWVEDIFPDFGHYFWRGMGDHLDKAKELWGQS